jgi:hypothetical protein
VLHRVENVSVEFRYGLFSIGTQHEAVLEETFLRHLVEPSIADAARYEQQIDSSRRMRCLKGVAQGPENNGDRRSACGQLAKQSPRRMAAT